MISTNNALTTVQDRSLIPLRVYPLQDSLSDSNMWVRKEQRFKITLARSSPGTVTG